jgi:hypothetical protein
MFRATSLIVVAACTAIIRNAEATEATPTQDAEITNAGGSGWQMSWRVSLDRLQRASKWNSESEPQLPVRQAVIKAREYLRSQGWPNQLPVTSVELRHVNGTPSQCFAYVLNFGEAFEPEKGSEVVLLLDGSIVAPVTTHPGPVKAAEFSPFDKPVLDFIRHAQAAYVFPVKSEPATRPPDKELRLLDAEARQALVALLSNEANWYHGLMTVGIVYPPGSVGFSFRAQNDELILFVASDCAAGCTVEGTFRGKDVFGMLNECAQPTLDNWKQRYAPVETHK